MKLSLNPSLCVLPIVSYLAAESHAPRAGDLPEDPPFSAVF
jgi:hypothetical protein